MTEKQGKWMGSDPDDWQDRPESLAGLSDSLHQSRAQMTGDDGWESHQGQEVDKGHTHAWKDITDLQG